MSIWMILRVIHIDMPCVAREGNASFWFGSRAWARQTQCFPETFSVQNDSCTELLARADLYEGRELWHHHRCRYAE